MRKILIIITTDFVPFGGLTTVMMNYYRALDKSKYSFDFASTNHDIDHSLLAELRKNGSEYYCLGNRKRNLITYIQNLRNLIKAKQYDIIHVNSNSATAAIELLIAKQLNVSKRIVHNHTSECDHKLIHKLLYPAFKHSYTDAVAVSKKAGAWIFPDGVFTVLNNGINTDRYRFSQKKREIIRNRYGVDDKTIVIGHLGKIYKPKNHRFLIDIFEAYHSDVHNSILLLVGDGEMRNEIEQIVLEKGLKNCVIFAGMQKEVENYLSAMDVFVFPSLWEGMPLSVIEAQASGLHCIISDSIDKDVCLTDYIQSLSIEVNPCVWANCIKELQVLNRVESSQINIQKIKEANYDSNVNSISLENIYDS